jgi:hypothetical protein
VCNKYGKVLKNEEYDVWDDGVDFVEVLEKVNENLKEATSNKI